VKQRNAGREDARACKHIYKHITFCCKIIQIQMIVHMKSTKKLIKIGNAINLIYTFAHNISKASIYIKKI